MWVANCGKKASGSSYSFFAQAESGTSVKVLRVEPDGAWAGTLLNVDLAIPMGALGPAAQSGGLGGAMSPSPAGWPGERFDSAGWRSRNLQPGRGWISEELRFMRQTEVEAIHSCHMMVDRGGSTFTPGQGHNHQTAWVVTPSMGNSSRCSAQRLMGSQPGSPAAKEPGPMAAMSLVTGATGWHLVRRCTPSQALSLDAMHRGLGASRHTALSNNGSPHDKLDAQIFMAWVAPGRVAAHHWGVTPSLPASTRGWGHPGQAWGPSSNIKAQVRHGQGAECVTGVLFK